MGKHIELYYPGMFIYRWQCAMDPTVPSSSLSLSLNGDEVGERWNVKIAAVPRYHLGILGCSQTREFVSLE